MKRASATTALYRFAIFSEASFSSAVAPLISGIGVPAISVLAPVITFQKLAHEVSQSAVLELILGFNWIM